MPYCFCFFIFKRSFNEKAIKLGYETTNEDCLYDLMELVTLICSLKCNLVIIYYCLVQYFDYLWINKY